MFVAGDGNLRKELGMTTERGKEVVKIIRSIMDQEASSGITGRTSHVLLDIAGRKDLNDVEKVACSFIFACRISGATLNQHPDNIKEERDMEIGSEHKDEIPPPDIFPDMSNMTNAKFADPGTGMTGMVIAPPGVSKEELISALMSSVTSLLRQLPKQDAQEFCRNASMIFAKMALTGDIRL